jgi:glycosyltransferase involved in cell wall biosynthesis
MVSEERISKELSIIIPVYNVEKYLDQCLQSVLAQVKSSYEVIIVDDGSTDNSNSIIEKYRSNPAIKVIRQNNAGLGAARNAGLKVACGEYLLFIDSDDWVEHESFSFLLDVAKKMDIDVIAFNHTLFFEDTNQTEKKGNLQNLTVNGSIEIIKEILLKKRVSNSACDKLYRRKLFSENNISFPVGVYFEDVITNIKIANYATSYFCSNKFLYYYRKRSSSITNTYTDKYYHDYLALIKSLEEYLSETGKKELVQSEFNSFVYSVFFPHYLQLIRDGNNKLLSEWNKLAMETGKFDISKFPGIKVMPAILISLTRNKIIRPFFDVFFKGCYRTYLRIK